MRYWSIFSWIWLLASCTPWETQGHFTDQPLEWHLCPVGVCLLSLGWGQGIKAGAEVQHSGGKEGPDLQQSVLPSEIDGYGGPCTVSSLAKAV